jgi:hypothetical protein
VSELQKLLALLTIAACALPLLMEVLLLLPPAMAGGR